MIEAVARAIYEADWPIAPIEEWEDAVPSRRALCRIKARAAIAAMREPTEAMNEAGKLPWRWTTHEAPPRLELPFGWTTADAWKAMIDAALSDK